MAARGHRISGLDISVEAIGHAHRTAARDGLDVELRVADMRDVPRDGTFGAALCMVNSFGYLDLAGTREFAAATAGALRPLRRVGDRLQTPSPRPCSPAAAPD